MFCGTLVVDGRCKMRDPASAKSGFSSAFVFFACSVLCDRFSLLGGAAAPVSPRLRASTFLFFSTCSLAGASTVVLEANTVAYRETLVVSGTNAVFFRPSTVYFLVNKIVFLENTVVI